MSILYSGIALCPKSSVEPCLMPPLIPPPAIIYADDDVPDDQKDFIELNAELAKAWPSITERKDAPVDASEWQNKPNKRDLLER